MKIPEGWPTKEMVEAAIDNLPNVNKEDVVFSLKAALSAAPTPPAPNNPWQEAALNECMAIEGCYVEDDPVKTIRCLIDWHVRNTANWTKGATPPAQEDDANVCASNHVVAHKTGNIDSKQAQEAEPAGFRWRKKGETDPYSWKLCHDIKQADDRDILKYTEIEFIYTRPSNDKLRKVAQEVWAYFHVADPIDCDEVENLMCKLRAELKGGIMTHLNLQPNQLTAFEKWALSKGYDIELFNEPNAEGSLDYRDPVTVAAYEGWLEGVLVGMKVRERDK